MVHVEGSDDKFENDIKMAKLVLRTKGWKFREGVGFDRNIMSSPLVIPSFRSLGYSPFEMSSRQLVLRD